MTRTTLTVAIAAAAGLLAAPWAIAWACFCPSEVSEERYFAVTSITQIEGEGDHTASELARWDGKARMTAGIGTDSAHLWLRVHLSDEQVRNVRIDTVAPSTPDDTADTGDTQGGE